MKREELKKLIVGPIATVPTPFDDDFEIENVTTVKRIKDIAISFLELRSLKIEISLLDLLNGLPAFWADS